MEKEYRILVTGACGVTSRSVVRALNKSDFFRGKCTFIGTDICNLVYAPYEGLYDKVYHVPPFNAPNYQEIMRGIIEENEIEYAFVIPEPEALFWSDHPFPCKYMRIPSRFGHEVISKRRLYENLSGTGLTPLFQILDKDLMFASSYSVKLDYPLWIRDYSEGTTSGLGSFLAKDYEQLKAWVVINSHVDTFMLAEYLPGRNMGCFLSFDNGKLIQYGVAERIQYVMSKVAVSGVTGNTSFGRLLNDKQTFEVAFAAVNKILERTGDTMNGLIVVDLKENSEGKPLITEINLRPVAFTSTFASGGLNFCEAQMLCMSNQREKIAVVGTILFPDHNAMLRDVDGPPIYLKNFHMPELGKTFIHS